MNLRTEGNYTGEFLISEAEGYRSRSNNVISQPDTESEPKVVKAGSIMQVTSSGELQDFVVADDLPCAVVYDNYTIQVDSSIKATTFVRDCEVVDTLLIDTGEAVGNQLARAGSLVKLAEAGVIVRTAMPVVSTESAS